VKALFAPVARLMSGRNKTKQLTLGVLFSIPLAIALAASPPGWNAAGFAVAIALAIAIYYLGAVLFTTDAAWNDIHDVARVLAEKDLRARSLPHLDTVTPANRAGRGQMGHLYQALRATHESLTALVAQAHRSADVARGASERLASGTVHLSQRTEDQASTLEEIAASIEELSATVKQNADSCRQASQPCGRRHDEGAQRRGRRGTRGVLHGPGRGEREAHRGHHRRDRGHRLPDQHPRVERRRRSGPRRRARTRLCRGRRGSAARWRAAAPTRRGRSRSSSTRRYRRWRRARASFTTPAAPSTTSPPVSRRRTSSSASSPSPRASSPTGVEGISTALSQLQGVTQQNAGLVQDAAMASVELKEEAARLSGLVNRFKVDEAPAAPVSAMAVLPPKGKQIKRLRG
jgi:hypothetical protein